MAGRMLTMAGRILAVVQAGRMLAMAGRTMGSVRGARLLEDAGFLLEKHSRYYFSQQSIFEKSIQYDQQPLIYHVLRNLHYFEDHRQQYL